MKKIITIFILLIGVVSLTSCKKLTVSFLNESGEMIKEIKVKKGGSIDLINLPSETEDHYYEWDKTNDQLKNIQQDITVNLIKKNKLTITFLNENNEIITTEKVKPGSSLTLPETPTNPEGYYYKWNKTEDSLTNIVEDTQVKLLKKEYNKQVTYIIDDEVIYQTTTNYFNNVQEPEIPEKYTNASWEETKELINNKYEITYTLKYDSKKLSITYIVNGEEVSLSPSLFDGSKDIILPDYEKEGYLFHGWFVGEISLYRYHQIDKDTNHDITLYAKMTKLPEDVTLPESTYKFTGITKTPHSSNPNLFVYQPVMPSDAATSSRLAYTWSTSDSSIATVSAYSSITAKKAGYCVLTATLTADPSVTINCLIKVSADGITYATPDEATTKIYTVTFKAQNGDIIEQQKVLSGQAALPPTPPILEGYVFDGWDTEIINIQADTTITATYKEGTNKYAGKKVAIIGDSISTYQDYIPEGYKCFYPYPTADVNDINQTWWMQVINKLGAGLFVNNSYSGSCVSDSGTSATQSDVRLATTVFGAETPDVIIIYMGSNDCASPYLGHATFGPAYERMLEKLQKLCPNAEIIVCTLATTIFYSAEEQTKYNNTIIECANKYGATLIDLSKVDISNYLVDSAHPNKAGMTLIAEGILEALLK